MERLLLVSGCYPHDQCHALPHTLTTHVRQWRFKINPEYPSAAMVRDEIITMLKGLVAATIPPTISVRCLADPLVTNDLTLMPSRPSFNHLSQSPNVVAFGPSKWPSNATWPIPRGGITNTSWAPNRIVRVPCALPPASLCR